MKIVNNDIKIGDVFEGRVNKAIIKIIKIDNKRVFYKSNGKVSSCGLEAFKRCLLKKIKEA